MPLMGDAGYSPYADLLSAVFRFADHLPAAPGAILRDSPTWGFAGVRILTRIFKNKRYLSIYSALVAFDAVTSGERYMRSVFCVVFLALVMFSTVSARAGTVQREEAKAAPPVRILKFRATFSFDEQGNCSKRFEQRYQILNQSGVEGWGYTTASWLPARGTRPEIRAKVTAPDGTVRALDPATISERPLHDNAPDVYSDGRELRAPLPAVSVGAVIEEEITEQAIGQFYSGGTAYSIVFQSNVPRDSVELIVDYPTSLPVRFETLDADVIKDEQTAGNRRTVTFRGGPYKAIEPLEAGAPDELVRWPHVIFSTGSSWRDLARAYHARAGKKPAMSGLPDVRALTEGARTDLEKANRILDFVHQKVRYAGIEFGESSIIPAAPEEALRRGYGDCKDQATLIQVLLAQAGVESRVALLLAGPGEDVRPDLPALNVFNHAILVIPGSNPIWVDPTMPYARAGELPAGDQGRLALIVDPETEKLVRIPESSAQDNLYTEVREVYLAQHGPARIVETTTAAGVLEQGMRLQFVGDPSAIKKQLETYVEKTYSSKKLTGLVYGRPEDLAQPYSLRIEAEDSGVGYTELLHVSVSLNERPLFSSIPQGAFGEEPRKTGLTLSSPHRIEVRYKIVPPEGFVAKRLPDFPRAELGPAVLERTASLQTDGSVLVKMSLTSSARSWSSDQVSAFRRGLKEYERESSDIVEFEHISEKLVNANRPSDALRVHQKASEQQPKTGIHLARMAVHLMDMGLGTTARETARYAARLDPESAVIQRTLGIVLMRDEFGRLIKPGYDRNGAIAAFKRAAKLNPDDMFSRIHAALLYEYDDDGRRYRDPADLEEAVKAYDAMEPEKLTGYDKGSYASNALFALMYAGKYRDLRERLRRLSVDRTPPVLAIVAETMLGGASAGLAEADRLRLRGEERSRFLAEASEIVTKERKYADAAALESAAIPGAADASAYENRARFLSEMRVVDPLMLPEATAAEAVTKAMLTYASKANPGADVSARLIARQANVADSGVRQYLKGFTEAASASTLRREVMADVMFKALRVSADGDPDAGYRVLVAAETGKGVRSYVFVVPEDGGLKLRAIDGELRDIGQQGLAFVKAKRMNAASKWLDWARQAVEIPGGEDPLRVPVWLRLWKDGRGSAELAAAALCADRCGPEGIGIVEAMRTDPELKDHALASLYLARKDYGRLVIVAKRLRNAFPQSEVARGYEYSALLGLRRFSELRAWIEREMKMAKPQDVMRYESALMAVDGLAGRFERVSETCTRIMAIGSVAPTYHNNCAWNSLFDGGATADTLKQALHAAQASEFKSTAALHTLAIVYAEMGRPTEARQTLLKLLDMRGENARPEDVDWYIVGRMAEGLGLKDAARSAYDKVKAPEEPASAATTHLLAKKRMAALGP